MQLSTENGYEDHPRRCGEHGMTPLPIYPRVGSSPQMRGAHIRRPLLRGQGRDHPRRCGEHGR